MNTDKEAGLGCFPGKTNLCSSGSVETYRFGVPCLVPSGPSMANVPVRHAAQHASPCRDEAWHPRVSLEPVHPCSFVADPLISIEKAIALRGRKPEHSAGLMGSY